MSISIRIKDVEFSSFEEFGRNIYLYPEESFKLINTKKFLTFLKKENIEYYNEIIKLRDEETNEGAFIFKAQYVFYPLMELRFYKSKYYDIKELGRRILNGQPKMDVYILDMIKYKLISYYLKLHHYDELEPTFFKKVIMLEENFVYNEARTYFKMGFVLAQTNEILYRRRWYKDVKEFFKIILDKTMIKEFASEFEKSQYIFAWLEILGYEKEINKFQAISSTIDQWEERT